MKSLAYSVFPISFLALCPNVSDSQAQTPPTLLRWQFKKNQLLQYRVQHTVTVTGAEPLVFKGTQNSLLTVRVKDVARPGMARLGQTIEWIQFRLEQGNKELVTFDSRKKTPPGGPKNLFASLIEPALQPVVGIEVSFDCDELGQVSRVEFPPALPGIFKKNVVLGVAAERMRPGMTSERGLKSMLFQLRPRFPVEPVVLGKSWHHRFTIKGLLEIAGGPDHFHDQQETEVIFTYKGQTKLDQHALDRIEVRFAVTNQMGRRAEKHKIFDQQGSGDFFFDNQRGRLHLLQLKSMANFLVPFSFHDDKLVIEEERKVELVRD